MFHAQELGSYAKGQGSLAVFKITARDQGHYKGFRGHLLHTVTFLVKLQNKTKRKATVMQVIILLEAIITCIIE